MKRKIPFSKARSELTDIVNHVAFGGDRIVLLRNGKQLAAIVPLDDLSTLEAIENRIDLDIAKRADKEIAQHGAIPWEEMEKKLGWDELPD